MLLIYCTKCNLGVVLEDGLYVKFLNACIFPLVSLVMNVYLLNEMKYACLW